MVVVSVSTINFLAIYFIMFMILSIIGYFVEIIDCAIERGVFTFSRGFLIGPYIPIYGVGALSMYFLLSKYRDDLLVLFILSMAICSVIEYLTSFVMEKMFNLRWWDYSDRKFNINGRIFLLNSVLFGVAGVVVCSFLGPWLYDIISEWKPVLLYSIAGSLFIIFIVDFIVSNVIVTKLKHRAIEYSSADATAEVREQIVLEIKKHLALYSRVFKSFPNILRFDKRVGRINSLVIKAKDELKHLREKLRMLLL